ncbi:3-hydroxyacyl-ACP dehydratase FabZ family protein [Kitasatospora sp. NPDC056181]|uniref:3-hydroxyacyl-ACP dehydratase FabZ family protein n=1 Tax=Kitasatospora sp. NPDC056181 TaxID=3345737 RepID=UPI0035E0194C
MTAVSAPVLPAAPAGVPVIKSLIPHRFPILLVDRVLELAAGRSIVTVKAVTCNEPWYQGVADDAIQEQLGYPVPLLIESWCQSAALLAAWDQPAEQVAGQVAVFGGMSDVVVRGAALPGDVLRHEVRISRALDGVWFFEGRTLVDGEPVLEVGSVMTALRPASALLPDGTTV